MGIQEALAATSVKGRVEWRVPVGVTRKAFVNMDGILSWDLDSSPVPLTEVMRGSWFGVECVCEVCYAIRYLNNKSFSDAQVTASIEALGNNARCLNESI